MSTNSAACQKKVDAAVRILKTITGLRIQQAMILAGFLKSDAVNEIVRQVVRCCKQQLESNAGHSQPSPNNRVVLISNKPSLSDMTSKDNGSVEQRLMGISLPQPVAFT
jgi:hypothetical protein